MIREIILDTETTGLSPLDGHRIVEIGAIELINHLPTGKTFHVYLDPQRDMPKEAEAVHGLSAMFLKGKPVFSSIADDFLAFIADSVLIIHNAPFDMSFIDAELTSAQKPLIDMVQVLDTLQMAKRKHPMTSNSLDALCRRYGVDASKRTKHGALLDSELLAEVYLQLIGGRQTALGLAAPKKSEMPRINSADATAIATRPRSLPGRLDAKQLQDHEKMLDSMGGKALWRSDA